MNAGTTLNVFPNEAIMEGSIRYFKSEVIDIFAARIESIAQNIAEAMMCKCEVKVERLYPPTVNHPSEVAHIKRLTEKWFGPNRTILEQMAWSQSFHFHFWPK